MFCLRVSYSEITISYRDIESEQNITSRVIAYHQDKAHPSSPAEKLHEPGTAPPMSPRYTPWGEQPG